jgi:hypothetical protein
MQLIDDVLLVFLDDFVAVQCVFRGLVQVLGLREVFLDITLKVAQPVLIKVLDISFGYVFGLQVFLMGFFKLFWMSIDVKTAENLAHVINYA